MADRPFLAPNATTASMASTITVQPTVLKNLTMASYSYSWSNGSTPVGTVTLQLSNDYSLNPNGSVNNQGTWTDAYWFDPSVGSYVSSAAVSGDTGNGVIEMETGAYAVRTVYTPASGDGTMTITFVGKVF